MPIKDVERMKSQYGTMIKSTATGPDMEPLRVAAEAVIFPNTDDQATVFMAAADTRPAAQAVRNFSVITIGLISLMAIGLVYAIFAQVRVGLRPLFSLASRVADVREGRARFVKGDYPKEIKPLADELNSLIGHNRDVVEYSKTHVSNLAHALKTPLAVLKNEAEDRKTVSADVVKRQTQSMSKQVDHHLRRARAAARGQAIGAKTNINKTVSSLVRALQRIYRDKPLEIHFEVSPDLNFRGERNDLEEIIGNLLDNACKWSDGQVILRATPRSDGSQMLDLTVSDNGPGLQPEQYEEVLKRGHRLDESTPGTGFGLSIVNDLVMAYKGTMGLSRADLGGLAVTISIPLVSENSGD